jgi:hypothetical protein
MPRFVVLLHEMPDSSPRKSHVDFMLEDGDVLRTWALDCDVLDYGLDRAKQLPDHRLEYLEFEGEISGNRGRVKRIDRGEYETLERNESLWRVKLFGTTFQEECILARDPDDEQSWTFQFVGP